MPTLKRTMPFGYAVPGAARDTVRKLLALHGVELDMIDAPATARAEVFALDSVARPTRPFQGHLEDTFFGKWGSATDVYLPAGTLIVRAGQQLGILAMYLLEPESDDGLATWNVLDPYLPAGRGDFPVVRIVQPLRTPLRPLK
jgi:hypothetical protein